MRKRRRSSSSYFAIGAACWATSEMSFVTSLSMAAKSIQGGKLKVHPVLLRQNDPSSPYCYAASSVTELTGSQNFLATQVWPSARAAAFAVEQYADPSWTICEFGCGPGMPSLAAAKLGCSVIATDVETLALDLVQLAAQSQGLSVETKKVDLIAGLDKNDWESWVRHVDMFVMSDVFESASVAKGSADITEQLLSCTNNNNKPMIWVFAQSDRAQREVYLEELKKKFPEKELGWRPVEEYDESNRLWLCDLDETKISYGS
jgi:hypothetical protein